MHNTFLNLSFLALRVAFSGCRAVFFLFINLLFIFFNWYLTTLLLWFIYACTINELQLRLILFFSSIRLTTWMWLVVKYLVENLSSFLVWFEFSVCKLSPRNTFTIHVTTAPRIAVMTQFCGQSWRVLTVVGHCRRVTAQHESVMTELWLLFLALPCQESWLCDGGLTWKILTVLYFFRCVLCFLFFKCGHFVKSWSTAALQVFGTFFPICLRIIETPTTPPPTHPYSVNTALPVHLDLFFFVPPSSIF